MTLQERIDLCDIKTQVFFKKLFPLLKKNVPYGFLPMDAYGLARRFSVSRTYCYVMLESLKIAEILINAKVGYACPPMIGDLVAPCVNKK
jgi:hypothetical protein